MRWVFFLSETDFLFKSASTPCEENSHIPIRTRPGITIQENLFLNGPTIQETYSQMGLLSRQTYSQMGLLSRQTYSQMGLLSRNVTPTWACTRVSGPIEPKSGFTNSKIPKMGLMIQESSQSLHRFLVEWEPAKIRIIWENPKIPTYDPEMSKSNMDCWGNQAKVRII